MKIHIIENNEFWKIDYIASYKYERISKKWSKEVSKLMIKNIESEINEEEEKICYGHLLIGF